LYAVDASRPVIVTVEEFAESVAAKKFWNCTAVTDEGPEGDAEEGYTAQ
jgi:hypothetical protein